MSGAHALPALRLVEGAAREDQVDELTVDFLRDILAKAERGEIHGVAVVTLRRIDHWCECGDGWAGAAKVYPTTLIGAFETLKARILAEECGR